jgi:uncharacterized protein (DUF305 family)
MKSFIAALTAAAAALFVSSCSGSANDGHSEHQQGSETSAPSAAAQPAGFNADDIAFATNMIPHHQQAVEMSAMVTERSTNPEVIKLAAGISAAQGPEIETLKVLLVQWKEGGSGDDTSGASPSPEGHDGHGMNMQGMIDDATMSRLEALKGAEFDELWLQSMIDHHRGAIEMANAEIANGANADAKNLAQQIVAAQQAEIGQMKQMLGG